VIRREIERTREEMSETVDAIGYRTDVKGRAKESIGEKVDSVKSAFTGAAGSVSDATPSTGDVKQGAKQAAGVAQKNPLGLALGSVAGGFLLGMLLPTTKVENEKLGPLSDQVTDQVKETASEALERGKTVAQDVAGTVGEHAQQAVAEAKDTAKESGAEQAQGLKESVTTS
jgi:hypothetical protein